MKRLLILLLLLVPLRLPLVALAQDVTQATEEKPYVLYVHEDCPHCQTVEQFIDKHDISDQISFVQLKDNEENMDELGVVWEELDLPGNNLGWPVMVYEEDGERTYEIGYANIIGKLANDNGIDDPEFLQADGETTTTADSLDENNDSSLFIFGGIIVLMLVIFAIFSIFGKKDEEEGSSYSDEEENELEE